MCHSSSWSPLLSSQVYLVSPEHEHLGKNKERHYWNIAKGTTDPRVEFISQVAHKSWSNFILQNLEQVSTSKSQTSRLKLNLKILAKPSFRISTKIQITSTKHQQKKLTKLQLQISPLLQLRNLDQTLCSKSEQKFSFLTKPQPPNLPQIVANTILITNISNSNNLNKFWVGIFTRQGHIN